MEELIVNMGLTKKSPDLFELLEKLNNNFEQNAKLVNSVTSNLVDDEFLKEITNIVRNGDVAIYFGKTLRDLKVVIQDDSRLRDHVIFLQYKATKKLIVSNVNLPHSSIVNLEYRTLEEVIETFRKYINDLADYLSELENIDAVATVMEPVDASFKDDYRRIYLDDRTWLHIEVTGEGLATNIHLVGQSAHWHNKLQSGLLTWDHDKSIIDNILTTFDLSNLPEPKVSAPRVEQKDNAKESLVCGICLCPELPDAPGVPQPLCQNVSCGVYYHRGCLYQWLVACAGSRPPAFGVANGECPTCLQPITCSEK